MVSIDGIKIVKKKKRVVDQRRTHKSKPIIKSGKIASSGLIFAKILTILSVIFVIFWVSYKAFSIEPLKSFANIFQLFKHSKYLILLQNNAELRPTGGFIGSFAVIDINYGKISNIYIDTNIYKRDNKYNYMLQIPAPKQMAHDGEYWSMHDANWSVDFPVASQQIAWFYENEGGNKVDAVVAVNASLIANLIGLIGPINLDKDALTVTKDNFFNVLHKNIEKDYFENQENQTINEPKTILVDLLNAIQQKVRDIRIYPSIISLVKEALDRKDILLYFYNDKIENLLLLANWGGQVRETSGDYLYINNSNQGGMKSSLNISQTVDLESSIIEPGSIIDNLTITRTHLGNGVWPDADNGNYMRILVPDKSRLISVSLDGKDVLSEVEITSEADRIAFGLWVTTNVGSTKILKVKYQIPFTFKNEKDYSLLLQKQPGALPDNLKITINNQVKYNGILSKDLEIK